MIRLNFIVKIEGETSSDQWEAIALRIAKAARGQSSKRAVFVYAGNAENWILCEGREPARIIQTKILNKAESL